jgi:hypothetical protein
MIDVHRGRKIKKRGEIKRGKKIGRKTNRNKEMFWESKRY